MSSDEASAYRSSRSNGVTNGPVKPLNRVVGERVAPVLGVADERHLALVGRVGREHLLEQHRRCLDFVGHLTEQDEKLLVAGKEAESKRHASEILAKKL